MNLHKSGVLEPFDRLIIVSDGGNFRVFTDLISNCLGPGHFKVYKTQYWMSCWSAQLSNDGIEYVEWNMYFPNLGHNICDGHAGHLKRYDFVSILFIAD